MIKYLFILSILFSSCAGYQLGGSQPEHLVNIKSIHIPLFTNKTLLFRAEAYATNSAIDAITRDGTYRIASAERADAVLIADVADVDYSQVSASRLDSQRAEELSITITINWKLVDANNPAKVLEKGRSKGKTKFIADQNISIARTNGLPDALRKASEAMVLRLADGY